MMRLWAATGAQRVPHGKEANQRNEGSRRKNRNDRYMAPIPIGLEEHVATARHDVALATYEAHLSADDARPSGLPSLVLKRLAVRGREQHCPIGPYFTAVPRT